MLNEEKVRIEDNNYVSDSHPHPPIHTHPYTHTHTHKIYFVNMCPPFYNCTVYIKI